MAVSVALFSPPTEATKNGMTSVSEMSSGKSERAQGADQRATQSRHTASSERNGARLALSVAAASSTYFCSLAICCRTCSGSNTVAAAPCSSQWLTSTQVKKDVVGQLSTESSAMSPVQPGGGRSRSKA